MARNPLRVRRALWAVAIIGSLLFLVAPVSAEKFGFRVAFYGGHYGFAYGFSHFRHGRRAPHGHHWFHRYRHRGHHGGIFFHFPSYPAYGYHRRYERYRGAGITPERRTPVSGPRVAAVFNGGDGWALLRRNRIRAAQVAFGGEAARKPGDASPKAGFALATAVAGELEMASWAMRRALHLDEHVLERVPVDESLSRSVLALIDEYALINGRGPDARNAAFMRAALHYILREADTARAALDTAVNLGERNPAADALDRRISRITPDR